MSERRIAIVGAGIIGLDVAFTLAEQGYGKSIIVFAEHLPGDTSIRYTSPWAGANFSLISGSDANALRWDQKGYARLSRLFNRFGEASMIQRTPSTEYWDEKPSSDKIKSIADQVDNFRVLEDADLPEGVSFGITFTTFTINAPRHVQWLQMLLQNEYGVRFMRRTLTHLHDVFSDHPHTKIVFNCTGNAARDLAGVEDGKCYPTRGQILLTRAPQVQQNMMRHGVDYETYIIPRPQSNGNVILGGFMQRHNDSPDTYGDETASIIERTHGLLPALNLPQTEVLVAFAGLRPSREGGARVEREVINTSVGPRIVVHNYGAGGTGFQAGLGMAADAVNLVEGELQSLIEEQKVSSRL